MMAQPKFQALACLACALVATLAFTAANAEPRRAVADDGREVILKDNGEWQYVTDDVFATTPEGQRIRLTPDHRWEKARDSDAPAYQPVPISTLQRDNIRIPASDVEVVLDQVLIENQRETFAKNSRVRSNLVLYLAISGAEATTLSPQDFVVQDSRGKQYPVFLVEQGKAPIGGQQRWLLRAQGAPRWWGVKFFSLQIAAGTFGNPEQIELRKPMRDVESNEVTDLPDDNL
jgi:hypothetical protein